MSTDFKRPLLLSSFTHGAGLSLAEASLLAYNEPDDVTDTVNGWSLSMPAPPFDAGDTQGFFAMDDELLTLSFRGTERNIHDWLRNLRVLPTGHDLGQVHRGFSSALNQVWEDDVKPLLRRHAPGRRVWLTGHSLGAALACLTAARTHAQLPEVSITGIVTFGQPRLAKNDFEENFNEVFDRRFHRYVNHRDIIPRVPPGYRHVGELIHFDDHGNVLEAGGTLEIFGSGDDHSEMTDVEFEEMMSTLEAMHIEGSACDPSVPPAELELEGQLAGLDFITGIRDHSMVDGYIPALLKNL